MTGLAPARLVPCLAHYDRLLCLGKHARKDRIAALPRIHMPWRLMSRVPWNNVSACKIEWLYFSGMVALKIRTCGAKWAGIFNRKSTLEFLPKCRFYILWNCNNKVCEIFPRFFHPFWLVLSPWKGNEKSAPIEKSPNHQGLGLLYFYDFWILGTLSPLLLCNTWTNTSTAKFFPFTISQL